MKCNLCGSSDRKTVFASSPYSVARCLRCGLGVLSPLPKQKDIEKFYRDENYFSSGPADVGYTDYLSLEHDLRKEAKRKIELMRRVVGEKFSDARLLDVGCGHGFFPDSVKEDVSSVLGCDISEAAVEYIKQHYSFEAVACGIDSDEMPEGPFDIITLWDVIEHLHNPKDAIAKISSFQRKGGYLFVSTPNLESLDAKLLGRFWYGFKRIPEHIYFFTPKTIGTLLESGGYELLRTKSWGYQRNLAYLIDQIPRYSETLYKMAAPFKKILRLKNVSFHFPLVDMLCWGKRK